LNWPRVRALMRKDLKSVTSSRMVVMPMIVVPLMLCLLMPAALTVLALTLGDLLVTGAEYIERLLPYYPVPPSLSGTTQRVLYVFLNYTFLPLFLLVPLMVSTIVVADAVAGEKERRTLETLLFSPLTHREFLAGKLLAAFLPALAVCWGGFVCYFVAVNLIGWLLAGQLLVRSWIWLPAMLLLAPAVSLLGQALTLRVSLRARTFMEAQQMSGVVVLPFVALLVVQVAGLVVFRPLFAVLLAAALAGLACWILARTAPRFTRERIVSLL